MFLVMGQHLIVEGLLEAQMQDSCHPYEEFQRETIMFNSILFYSKYISQTRLPEIESGEK